MSVKKANVFLMKLRGACMGALARSVLTYDATGWALIKADENMIQLAELGIYSRILRISWD